MKKIAALALAAMLSTCTAVAPATALPIEPNPSTVPEAPSAVYLNQDHAWVFRLTCPSGMKVSFAFATREVAIATYWVATGFMAPEVYIAFIKALDPEAVEDAIAFTNDCLGAPA